ncbi:MAG TPA: ATP-binding protein [Acidimicrobiales bacterium]|nr:ATP-binding protein [Acidimicrobiales bacterium]
MSVVWVARKDSTRAAVSDAQDITVAKSTTIGPLLSDGILTGDRQALAALDGAVRGRVLSPRTVRVKIWNTEGRILYADRAELIGQHFGLGSDERGVLLMGGSLAHVSDLSEPENAMERPFHKLLEVYVGMRTTGGTPVLFESYLRFSSITAESRRTMASVTPAFLAGLALLLLVQIPVAWSMARRVQRGREQEKRLLSRAVEAGAVERRHIAADLHDGVVQSLAGNAFSLAAAAFEADRGGMTNVSRTVRTAAAEIRQTVRELRHMIVAIAPPRLHEEGLASALGDVLAPLHRNGVTTTLSVDPLPVDHHTESLVFRAAQEALRNVARHSGASHVGVTVNACTDKVRLMVEDDGAGFASSQAAIRRSNGHMGLPLLAELAEDAGGRLDVQSQPGHGTRLVLEVPVR